MSAYKTKLNIVQGGYVYLFDYKVPRKNPRERLADPPTSTVLLL